MSYQVSSTSAGTVVDLRRWVSNELIRVGLALSTNAPTVIPVINAAPAKPQTGQIVFADGTNWNPSGGRGLYYYDSGWTKIA
tara:strand:+ start:3175 stop:3420 length:246 start_codon:yes stop_codon:yes gene_type:complete